QGGSESALGTDLEFHQIVQGLLEPPTVRKGIQDIKEQRGRCGDSRQTGTSLPIGIARPDPQGVFGGDPNGPGILKAKTGPGLPGDGAGGIEKAPIFIAFGPVDLIEGLKGTV